MILSSLLSISLYLVAAGLLGWRLRAEGPAALRLSRTAFLLCAGALLLHAVLLQHSLFHDEGLRLGLAQAVSLFTWQSALLLCLFSLRRPLEGAGLLILPLAALGAGLAGLRPGVDDPLVRENWAIQLHIVLSLLAYGVLTLAAVQAVVVAVQDRQLHRGRSAGRLRSLPALDVMEQLLFELIAVGFFLLSLALLSGLLFVENLLAQHLVHKTVLAVAAWVFFAVLLWGRWRHGWRGRVAIRWTLGAYLALLLAYFGSKYVLEILLHTHWR